MTNRMRMRMIYALVAGVLITSGSWLLAAGAASGGLPPGTYATTIAVQDIPSSFPPEYIDILVGYWEIELSEGGTAFAFKNGELVVFGRYVSNPARLVFHDEGGDLACTAPGTATGVYRWLLQNDTLVLTRIQDRCEGRAFALTTHPLQKVR